MQVRNLIEQLQRFDPSAKVTVTAFGRAHHIPSGTAMDCEFRCQVDLVKSEQGEPVIEAFE